MSDTTILAISDTHGSDKTIANLLRKYKNMVSDAIHLGDHARDMTRFADKYSGDIIFHVTNGNTDPQVPAYKERVIEISGKRIFITHGHLYDVKANTNRLVYKANELGVDACLFGHSHAPTLFTQDDIVFLNPGSPAHPREGTKKGYGLITISEDGTISGQLLGYEDYV